MDIHNQSKIIGDSAKLYLRDLGWSEDDINYGVKVLTIMMISFCLGDLSGIPSSNEKFPDLLRCLANCMELSREIVKKELDK